MENDSKKGGTSEDNESNVVEENEVNDDRSENESNVVKENEVNDDQSNNDEEESESKSTNYA